MIILCTYYIRRLLCYPKYLQVFTTLTNNVGRVFMRVFKTVGFLQVDFDNLHFQRAHMYGLPMFIR